MQKDGQTVCDVCGKIFCRDFLPLEDEEILCDNCSLKERQP